MRLGIGSYAYAWSIGIPGFDQPANPMDAFAFLEAAITNQVSAVQYADNLPLTELGANDLDTLAARARSAGIAIEVGTRGIEPTNLREYLRLAVRFGAPFVRVVIDKGGDEPSADEAVERLRPLMPEFADADVALAIENHDRFSARALREIVERLGPENAGICLDTVNSLGALEGPDLVVATLAPYVRNLHVKDFTMRRISHQLGFVVEGCPAGKGRLNLPDLLPALPTDISAILELWPPPLATIAETVDRERVWVDESLVYLRTVIR